MTNADNKKHRFDWWFGNCCQFNVHSYPEIGPRELCYCGQTRLILRNGGWDAVWNLQGVSHKNLKRRIKSARKK